MDTVPFGKYFGQPIETFLADLDYIRWVMSQPSLVRMLRSRHPELFNMMTVGAPTTDDTPEHNKLQAMFTDETFAHAFCSVVVRKYWESDKGIDPDSTKFQTRFEHGSGFDVAIYYTGYGPPFLLVEIKPQMGDDYPAVLRQIRQNMKRVNEKHRMSGLRISPCLLLGKFEADGATFDQVKRMFGEIYIITLDEVFAEINGAA